MAVTWSVFQANSVGGGSGSTTIPITTPAGGAPVGSLVTIFGSGLLTGCSDVKGNVWVTRFSENLGFCVESCIRTALVSGDTISVVSTRSQWACVALLITSPAVFDVGGAVSFSGTAATGPAKTTTAPGDLVIGAFWAYGDTVGNDPLPAITTPGAGYTDQAGVGNTGSLGNWSGNGLDYETKIAGAVATETPTATLNLSTGTLRSGMTICYREPLPRPKQTRVVRVWARA